jgi:SanA protein
MIGRLLKYFFYFIQVVFLLLVLSNIIVLLIAKNGIEEELSGLPANSNLIVLGTSKHFASGGENLFYKNRIAAAKQVLDSLNPKHTILSGSHASEYYNEPQDMQLSLEELGFSPSDFILDENGENTYASLRNYAERYNGDSVIIVTQKFHAYRCIVISKDLGIKAVVYPAEAVSVDITNKPAIREVFARAYALWNIYIFNA